ncbi:hypothetical protein F0M21_03715 [Bacillus velezensis]|uniref:Uncharacterized protein n=1 Tax=Bacillus velezensis (strain DSM 23117 / BGSC 10A6 / LMG 26770 / FZB42) TaxID=326423 RepID=A0A4Y6A8G7_BACVZ|nr:hypothetical protein [Bacillus velezensis]QDE58040.1 hypothetical protein RBAM_38325 [Bacillus velezensis FZB42]UNE50066.1 hypothetical protein F5K02_04060 [Bacillus amyloliquefaciens]QEO29780.1 hypothetical protein F0M21_03715 [Bacillus velezensis]TNU47459.1 hypothetical protein FH503_16245 [Bacillus velezensis]
MFTAVSSFKNMYFCLNYKSESPIVLEKLKKACTLKLLIAFFGRRIHYKRNETGGQYDDQKNRDSRRIH